MCVLFCQCWQNGAGTLWICGGGCRSTKRINNFYYGRSERR
nr:MAG TPA: hypothetical protein [Caudoviricetes sp.]